MSKPEEPAEPQVVELDAMDEAEWERDKHTPRAPQAHLEQLVGQTVKPAPAAPAAPAFARTTTRSEPGAPRGPAVIPAAVTVPPRAAEPAVPRTKTGAMKIVEPARTQTGPVKVVAIPAKAERPTTAKPERPGSEAPAKPAAATRPDSRSDGTPSVASAAESSRAKLPPSADTPRAKLPPPRPVPKLASASSAIPRSTETKADGSTRTASAPPAADPTPPPVVAAPAPPTPAPTAAAPKLPRAASPIPVIAPKLPRAGSSPTPAAVAQPAAPASDVAPATIADEAPSAAASDAPSAAASDAPSAAPVAAKPESPPPPPRASSDSATPSLVSLPDERDALASPRAPVARTTLLLAGAGALLLLVVIVVAATRGGDDPVESTAASLPPRGEGAQVALDPPHDPRTAAAPTPSGEMKLEPARPARPAEAGSAADAPPVEPVVEPTPDPTPVVARPARPSPTLGGKRVVLEYDSAAPKDPARVAPVAKKGDDTTSIAAARNAYFTGNRKLFAGDTDAAIRLYRHALATYPGYVAGYRGLGLAYAQKGDKANALKALRTYVAAVPGAKDVPLIKKRIATLQR